MGADKEEISLSDDTMMTARDVAMLVSVIVCTHSIDNYQNLLQVVNSLLEQSHKDVEIIVVVDGNRELYHKVAQAYDAQEKVGVVATRENVGLSGARNEGIARAQGDVIAFLDDDAIADRGWVENLVATYQEFDAIAVGGKILPIWLCERPDYLPEELDWLVGITHEGFAQEKVVEVRNTFGPNMSFRREVFDKVGLFNQAFGFARRGTSYIQAEEAELCLRMRGNLGKGVMYNPQAIVYHKIPPSKVKAKILLKRSFYQGYSKALLRNLNPSAEPIATEKSYLNDLLFKYIPRRMKTALRPSHFLVEAKKLSILVASIFSVGLGFLYCYLKRPPRFGAIS